MPERADREDLAVEFYQQFRATYLYLKQTAEPEVQNYLHEIHPVLKKAEFLARLLQRRAQLEQYLALDWLAENHNGLHQRTEVALQTCHDAISDTCNLLISPSIDMMQMAQAYPPEEVKPKATKPISFNAFSVAVTPELSFS